MLNTSTPQFKLSEYLKKFNPSDSFTKVPKLNIAEQIGFPVVGTYFPTGERNVDISKSPTNNNIYGESPAIPSFDDLLNKVGAFTRQDRRDQLAYRTALNDFEKAQQIDLINQLYPVIDKAAQRATERNLGATLAYEGNSPKYANIFAAQAGATEANLKNAIANQALAAAAMRGRYQGRNIGFG